MLICTIKCTDKCKEIIKLSQQCIGNMTDIFNNQGNKLLESITQKLEKEETFYFEPYKRLNIEQTPTLFCDNGEKTQDSKIYPITADEVVFAGAKSDETNNNFYLADNLTNYGTTTVTIYGWDLAPFSQIYYLYNGKLFELGADSTMFGPGARPVISLKPDTPCTSGSGLPGDAYIIN